MTKNKVSQGYIIVQPLLLGLMVAVGILLGYKMNEKSDTAFIQEIHHDETPPQIGRVEELIRFIESKYVDELESDVLIEEAINGLLKKLDPHSVYLTPSRVKDVNQRMEGTFRGIGIESFLINDTVHILKVLKDSPAEKAGIKQFDQLLAINDSVVAGVDVDYTFIKNILKSDDKGRVQLDVLHKGRTNVEEVFVQIEDIAISSISHYFMVNDSTGFIKLKVFTESSYKDFLIALEDLAEHNDVKNLIFDLRGNPGGYLPEANKILNQLLRDKDQLMLYTEGRNRPKEEYKSNGKVFYFMEHLAILVDEESASGSEIIAGAIQDWDRGAIIGRTTYGKGLVQEQYNLANGGALRLTTARYFTPTGRSIQRDYSNREVYINEIQTRYVDGSLFNRDSVKHNEEEIYSTLMLNRPVHSNGGVDPDIFIPVDSVLFKTYFHEANSMTSEFVFRNVFNNNLNSIDEFDNSNIWDLFIGQVENRFPNFSKDSITKREKSLLVEQLKGEYLYVVKDDLSRAKHMLNKDSFILSALDFFKSPYLKELD